MEIKSKIIKDYDLLKSKLLAHKILGHKVICTIGSWDMLHIGHLRYLNRSRQEGDILVVGVDSDRGIKSYKGPNRPIIPEDERMEMLCYQNCVDYVTLVDDITENGEWEYRIIKEMPVDIFVAVSGNSYTPKQIKEIKNHCKLMILPRQAEKTSSTDIIQNVLKNHLLSKVSRLKSKKR
ncbi:MAG: adenylyltransferase/cytidyltransferase family protein [Patescibacteria group bacterium]